MQSAALRHASLQAPTPFRRADPTVDCSDSLAVVIHAAPVSAPAAAPATLRSARVLEIDARLDFIRRRVRDLDARLERAEAYARDISCSGGLSCQGLLSGDCRVLSLGLGGMLAMVGYAVWTKSPEIGTVFLVIAGICGAPLVFEALVCLAACAYGCRATCGALGRGNLENQLNRLRREITPLLKEKTVIQREDINELLTGLAFPGAFCIIQGYVPEELGRPAVRRLQGAGVPSEAGHAETDRPAEGYGREEAPAATVEESARQPDTL